MTFVPISPLNGEMSEVCHSQLYKQSPLFSVIQSLTTGSIIYRINDFIKFSAERKTRIGKIHSFCFNTGKNTVIDVKLYLRGLEVRNHYSYTSITSKKDQIVLTDVIYTVEKELLIKKITCPSEISGMYFLSKHEEQNFIDSSFNFISDKIPWFEVHSFEKDVPKPDIPKGKKEVSLTNGFYMSIGNLPRPEGAKRANMHVIGLGEPKKKSYHQQTYHHYESWDQYTTNNYNYLDTSSKKSQTSMIDLTKDDSIIDLCTSDTTVPCPAAEVVELGNLTAQKAVNPKKRKATADDVNELQVKFEWRNDKAD
ncbi:unnamed protein product [Mytilus edulis]|uniref:Uncharacterized protein n=1 Tax=Mytilus edulis TaxID=6550 RepID=A0A8S3TSL5_MYTED|nr:unnamed protein product [Mytilus edulis]